MTKTLLTRGSAAGVLAAMLSACGHLPIAPQAFEDMSAKRAGLPTDWTIAPMTGDATAIVADFSVFGDPNLTAYVAEALENNRSLRATAENIRQSEALLRQARSGLFPSLFGSVGVNASTPVDDFNLNEIYSVSATAAYAPDVMGDVSASVRASIAGLRSTEATYEFARRQLAAQTARAYFAIIEAKLQLELNRRSLNRAKESNRITQARFDEGSVARDDLVLDQSDLASAEDSVIAFEASVRTAERALETLLGRFSRNQVTTAAVLPSPPEAPPLGVPEFTIRSRPDVVAAEYNLIQVFAQNRVARLARWPQLNGDISLALSNTTPEASDLFDIDDLIFRIGASLADTLFDGGLIEGRIDASDAVKRGALERYGQTVIEAYNDVLDSLDQFTTLRARSRSLTTASDAARETLRLGELRYSEGSQALLDVLIVRNRADVAESALISNRRALLEQWVLLHLALGGDPVAPSPLPSAAATAEVRWQDR
ncbi:efflux transporter outer membrane subunit [bacterium]|nr:efflux transporter outer membrane subunit [bacterium]